MFPFLFWFAFRDDTRNKDAKREYNSIQNKNNEAESVAIKTVKKSILKQLDMFITKHKDDDIIIDTGMTQYVKIPRSYKRRKNIYFGYILMDATGIYADQNYLYQHATLDKETIETGGGLVGYSVSETSSGYEVTPNYGNIVTAESYVITKDSPRTSSCSDVIYVKAVKRGTAEKVIQQERELVTNRDKYDLAKKYKDSIDILENGLSIPKKMSRLYNWLAFICELCVLLLMVFMTLSISDETAQKYLLTSMLVKLIFGHPIVWLNYSLYCLVALYLILIVAFIIMRHIKKFFVSNSMWYDYERKDCQDPIQYVNEWQDSTTFKHVRLLIILASITLPLTILLSFVTSELMPLPLLGSILMDIVIVIWFFWFVIYMPGAILDIKNNPNYNRGRQDIKIIKEFIFSGGCEKYDDLIREVHDCTVKDNT